jgi:hypothetical protein
MDIEKLLSIAFLIALFVGLEVYIGRLALKGLRTGMLRVPMRGGDRIYSRASQPKRYWFWLCCMLGAVLITGPFAIGAMVFENASR